VTKDFEATEGMSDDSTATEDVDRRLEIKVSDFYFGCTLGEGAYARVVHAKSKHSHDEYAVKIMEKVHIKKENKVGGLEQLHTSFWCLCLTRVT